MNLWSFFFGLIVCAPFAFVCLRLSKGRFMMIRNIYFAGALYGFWLWILSIFFLYLDSLYDFVGIVRSDQGISIFAVFSSAHAGFITGGLLAAWFSTKIATLRK
jgi:hypothetical protein